jgi:hypothetical protein
MGGIGGDAPMGGGEAVGGTNQGDGSPGNPYGGGGGGAAADTTTGTAGGAGASGVIKITEYFDSGSAAILAGGLPTGGSAGQLLSKNSGTNYDASWASDLGTAAYQSTVISAPTGTTSTTGVMMGLNLSAITPVRSGKVFVSIMGRMGNNAAGSGVYVRIYYGTGTPPANGVAITGTPIGAPTGFGTEPAAGSNWSFNCTAVITGLTLGVTIWLDLSQAAVTSGTASANNISVCAYELP